MKVANTICVRARTSSNAQIKHELQLVSLPLTTSTYLELRISSTRCLAFFHIYLRPSDRFLQREMGREDVTRIRSVSDAA